MRGSPDGVRRALQRLAGQGVVESRSHGRAVVYTLNRRHLAAEALVDLATLTARLVEAMADEIRAWPIAPVHASLFGSAARGGGDETSDIDLFVVRPEGIAEMNEQWNRQLGILKVSVWSWSGNDLQIIERSPSELRAESEAPLVKGLLGEARLLVGHATCGRAGAHRMTRAERTRPCASTEARRRLDQAHRYPAVAPGRLPARPPLTPGMQASSRMMSGCSPVA